MGVIRGRVVDEAGRPVPGAAIYVISAPVPLPDVAQLSGDDGRFALAAPAPGNYVLGARHDSAGSGQSTVVVEGDEATADISLTGSSG